MMLNVLAGNHIAGQLNRVSANTFSFTYLPDAGEDQAVSLTMPVRPESWIWRHGLHPIFDMNLPEGALRRWIEDMFSKAIPDFDDLELLKITGGSQVGRLQYREPDTRMEPMQSVSVEKILTYQGSEDLFRDLLEIYATSSGISGVQPKILIRASDGEKMSPEHKLTVQSSTHIVKTWDARYPELARNEYCCLRAAQWSNMQVPPFSVSDNGRFLIVERFDMGEHDYLGLEDFCVLQGLASKQKYSGSLERLLKTLKAFTQEADRHATCREVFKMIVLSVGLRNGDAHLKNFCLLYDTPARRSGRLAPVFDHITTTAYLPKDTMALTLKGTKRWPTRKKLMEFATIHCDLPPREASRAIKEVAEGISQARKEVKEYGRSLPGFRDIAEKMLQAWEEGLAGLSGK
jgi:serine/threonine-protein kinase HipA